MNKYAQNLTQNTPTFREFQAMMRAGFDIDLYNDYSGAISNREFLALFANLEPLHNGEYLRADMEALNRRMHSGIAVDALYAATDAATVKYVVRETPEGSRMFCVVNGGKTDEPAAPACAKIAAELSSGGDVA